MPNGVQSLKYDTLSLTGDPIRLNDRTVEWRNGGMAEYLSKRNASLYETKVL